MIEMMKKKFVEIREYFPQCNVAHCCFFKFLVSLISIPFMVLARLDLLGIFLGNAVGHCVFLTLY